MITATERGEDVSEAVRQPGAEGELEAEGWNVYTCRMCRRVVFSEEDLESHQTAQQSFHRRKAKGLTSAGVCSSFFLAEPPSWMEEKAGELEGKFICPNKICGARLGSLKWTGAQCSCGSWVTPAIQFPKKNLDVRSTSPSGPPAGTIMHSSLLVAATNGDESRTATSTDGNTGQEEITAKEASREEGTLASEEGVKQGTQNAAEGVAR